jgi:hypothetical protein
MGKFVSFAAECLRAGGAAAAFPWVVAPRPLLASDDSFQTALEFFTGRPLSALEEMFGTREFDQLLDRLGLGGSARDPGASPQSQMLRDLSPNLGVAFGQLLAEVGAVANSRQTSGDANWLEARGVALDAARAASTGEEAGYFAAPEIRRVLGLGHRPFTDVTELLNPLGISYGRAAVEGGPDRMVVAARVGGSPVVRTLSSLRTSTAWGERFEACRAVGHALLDPLRGEALGAASGPFAGVVRRRRSGAFAAELLLPEAALAEASRDRLDGVVAPGRFEGLLNERGVGARTAANHLFNRGWLSGPDVRDELIDRFAGSRVG